jgi:hypothetical protein
MNKLPTYIDNYTPPIKEKEENCAPYCISSFLLGFCLTPICGVCPIFLSKSNIGRYGVCLGLSTLLLVLGIIFYVIIDSYDCMTPCVMDGYANCDYRCQTFYYELLVGARVSLVFSFIVFLITFFFYRQAYSVSRNSLDGDFVLSPFTFESDYPALPKYPSQPPKNII